MNEPKSDEAARSSRADTTQGPTASPAVFLDRDGTIIEDRGHIDRIEQVEFYPFTIEALRLLQKHYRLFIVTNQSGVGRGLVAADAVARVNEYVANVLHDHGIGIARTYCCPHTTEERCACAKPHPFFIRDAQRAFGLDIGRSYAVGDHPHDVAFGEAAGAAGLYVLTGHGRKHSNELKPGTRCFENVLDAARWIAAQTHPVP